MMIVNSPNTKFGTETSAASPTEMKRLTHELGRVTLNTPRGIHPDGDQRRKQHEARE